MLCGDGAVRFKCREISATWCGAERGGAVKTRSRKSVGADHHYWLIARFFCGRGSRQVAVLVVRQVGCLVGVDDAVLGQGVVGRGVERVVLVRVLFKDVLHHRLDDDLALDLVVLLELFQHERVRHRCVGEQRRDRDRHVPDEVI